MNKIILLSIIAVFLLINCNEKNHSVEKSENKNNNLTDSEKNDGWILLFDGNTLNGWHEFGEKIVGHGWIVDNGEISCIMNEKEHTGDLVTNNTFANFDFICEWKISAGGNSGLFYHIIDDGKYTSTIQTAPEYQLIDDIGFPAKLEEWQKTGANYAMHNVEVNKKLKPVGEWNLSRIVVQDSIVSHYLNGEKILEFKQWTKDWFEKVKNSKWKEYPDYGIHKDGHIGLQSHGSSIWFRNIKIKSL